MTKVRRLKRMISGKNGDSSSSILLMSLALLNESIFFGNDCSKRSIIRDVRVQAEK